MRVRVAAAALACLFFPSSSYRHSPTQSSESAPTPALRESSFPADDIRSPASKKLEYRDVALGDSQDDWRQIQLERSYAYAGLPVSAGAKVQVIKRIGYVSGYDKTIHQPRWVAFKLGAIGPKGTHRATGRLGSSFLADRSVDPLLPSNPLRGTGYDHGHLAPNYAIGSRYGDEAGKETFSVLNISPMKPTLNQRTWRQIEQVEADNWANEFEEIWIVTGPIFDKTRELVGNTVIEKPDAFFRILIDEVNGKPRALCLLLSQDELPTSIAETKKFLRTIRAIEEATGLDFNRPLRDSLERPLEDVPEKQLWPR